MSISAYPPRRPQQWSPEERYRFLSTILESFAGTLDLEEALRRIANITLEQFAADRVMLVHPITDGAATAVVRYALNAPRITNDNNTRQRCKDAGVNRSEFAGGGTAARAVCGADHEGVGGRRDHL